MARGPSLADRVAAFASGLAGVSEHPSQFAPMRAWWVDGREFAHVRGGKLTVRLTRGGISANRHRLRDDPRVGFDRTDWVDVRLRVAGDLALALELFTLALAANRRRLGEAPQITPDDRALARRRRLHSGAATDLER